MGNNRLGKGIEAIIRSNRGQESATGAGVSLVSINRIKPNPNQPRRSMDQVALQELAESIKVKGLLTPVTIKDEGDDFILVAGERRWRAAQMVGLKEIPAYVVEVSGEAELMEMALIENIQRENLNAIEESEAFAFLAGNFNLTQDQIAESVGKKRVTITNSLRLLNLPKEIKRSIHEGEISAGHGRAILMMKTTRSMDKLWKRILKEELSVRRSESLAQTENAKKKTTQRKTIKTKNPQITGLENKFISILGTKVRIIPKQKGGIIEISYFSDDDLDRITDIVDK